ncbi:HlyD family secretion protein [Paraburkholderia bonniea]|uniref:HlyD family secretion protein n=1 Tax=Paraburkholderia bonniea TaxID=2152891 RepID=UPI0012929F6B|nr:HlyD family efflux transporter periplasmic adaptor subunit [Paraburkholderia bonniea]
MTSPDPLFRTEARDAQCNRSLGTIVLIRPISFAILTAAASCIALIVVLFFAFGSYTRRTTVEGILVPDSGLVKVYARQQGIVLKKSVTEGQYVTRGQVLYTISTDLQSAMEGQTQAAIIIQARQRKASLQEEIDKTRTLQQNEHEMLQARIASLRAELGRINEQFIGQRIRTSIAADTATRYESLLTKNYVSKDQAQQRQADLLDQQSKLHGLQRERARTTQTLSEALNEFAGLPLKQQNQLSKIARSVIDVDEALIESEAKRELAVTAPETGTATATMADPGQMINGTQPLVSIVPTGAQWQAHLFVPSNAIGFIRVDDSVLIRYQAYPYQKFGQYQATIHSVTRSALSAAELASSGGPAINSNTGNGTFYRITATLKDQTVTVYGKPHALQAGMMLQADILQERRRLYEWVLEPLYSLTGKL